MSIYKKHTRADQLNLDGGYKNLVYFAPKEDFTSIKGPAAPGSPVVLGDSKKITLAHTFPVGNGFITFETKKGSVTSKFATEGDDGVGRLKHTFEFTILGDSAVILEMTEKLLRDDCIWLLKDQDCVNTTDFTQFGDECDTPIITAEGEMGTTKEGVKMQKFTGTIVGKKYRYSGAVTEKPTS